MGTPFAVATTTALTCHIIAFGDSVPRPTTHVAPYFYETRGSVSLDRDVLTHGRPGRREMPAGQGRRDPDQLPPTLELTQIPFALPDVVIVPVNFAPVDELAVIVPPVLTEPLTLKYAHKP